MFVQVIRAPVGDRATVHEALAALDAQAPGLLGSTSGLTTDGELILVLRFESETAARRHRDHPGQRAWWAELQDGLAAPVSVFESAAVDVSMGGGSDDAGFVQVFWGTGDRDAARRAMVTAEPVLRSERPDILGGFTVWGDDGRFVDVAYFRSERAAREGEAKELSERGRAVFEEFARVLAAEGYADIPEPRLR